MAIVQGTTIEASARMEWNSNEDVVNVFQFHLESAVPLTDAQGIDDVIEFLEAIYTIITSSMTLIQLYRDIRIRNWDTGQVYGTFPWPTLTIGGSASTPLPSGVAAMINFSTGVARVTPRKYFGGFVEDALVGDATWTPALQGYLTSVAALMLVDFTAVNGVWSYGYQSPKTGVWEYPTGAVVTDVPAYQRRRRPGRGS